MDYNALIQNRRSARQFTNEKVTDAVCAELESYYRGGCQKLVPQISTELRFFGSQSRQALERAAGYNEFLVGAPQYLVLLSEKAEHLYENLRRTERCYLWTGNVYAVLSPTQRPALCRHSH